MVHLSAISTEYWILPELCDCLGSIYERINCKQSIGGAGLNASPSGDPTTESAGVWMVQCVECGDCAYCPIMFCARLCGHTADGMNQILAENRKFEDQRIASETERRSRGRQALQM